MLSLLWPKSRCIFFAVLSGQRGRQVAAQGRRGPRAGLERAGMRGMPGDRGDAGVNHTLHPAWDRRERGDRGWPSGDLDKRGGIQKASLCRCKPRVLWELYRMLISEYIYASVCLQNFRCSGVVWYEELQILTPCEKNHYSKVKC